MKNALILSLFLASTSAFSSTFANLKQFTNPTLAKANQDITAAKVATHSAAKKILVLKANGKTPLQVRTKTVAQAIHSLCGFFDDGVEAVVNKKNDEGSQTAVDEFFFDTSFESDAIAKTTEAIKAVNADSTLEVYSGSASGNNTVGTVLGFFDVENNELAVYANTNCGSDN